jgi:putative aldouronate transport system permease protein
MTEMAARLGRDVGDLPKETARMAMCVITIGPILLVFPFFQKYFVKGIVLGAIKG